MQAEKVKKTEGEEESTYKQKCVHLNKRHGIIIMQTFPHRYITLLSCSITLLFIILGLELLKDETQAEMHGDQFKASTIKLAGVEGLMAVEGTSFRKTGRISTCLMDLTSNLQAVQTSLSCLGWVSTLFCSLSLSLNSLVIEAKPESL